MLHMKIKHETVDEIIEMAWCDKTSFDNIEAIVGLSEKEVIKLMRGNLKPSSFKLWRKRVTGRKAKHAMRLIKSYINADNKDSTCDPAHFPIEAP